MKELKFKILTTTEITDKIASNFIGLLVKQGKVVNPEIDRIQKCREILLCFGDDKLIGIGALKPKTNSDFEANKSNLKSLSSKFTWELGYFYVDPNCRGYGISTTMAKLLLVNKSNENIMASTELYPNNPMIKVLEKAGFQKYGKPWASGKHDGTLGLFLRFKMGE